MASRGISLSFLADVRDFLRGTSSAQDALEDIGQALDSVVQDSASAQAEMESDFRAIAADASKTGTSIGTDLDKGFDKAGQSAGQVREGFKGTGDELAQEGLSGAGAFDGSMESAADSAQAFSSVALAAFGPIGIGLGVAAAAGFGLFRKSAEKAKEAVDELAAAIAEAGGKIDSEVRKAQLQKLYDDGELQKFKVSVEALGLAYEDNVSALDGNAAALERIRAAQDRSRDSVADGTLKLSDFAQANTEMNEVLEAVGVNLDKAQDKAALMTQATAAWGLETEDNTDSLEEHTEAVEADTKALGDNADQLLELRGQLRDVEQAYDDALKLVKEHGAGLDISTQKGRDNQAALDSLASSILADGEVRKAEAQKYLDVAEAMGLSEKAAERLQRRLELLPTDTRVKVQVEVDPATLQGVKNKLRAQGFRWDDS